MYRLIILVLLFSSCIKEEYTYVEQKCIDGYYKEYRTGGRMVNKPTMDANRLEKRWVCTKHVPDTIVAYRWVLKK